MSPTPATATEQMPPQTDAAAHIGNDDVAAGVVVEGDRYVTDRTVQQYDRDPRLTRWGYNPACRGVSILDRMAGLQNPFVPVGEFFPVRSFETPEENFTLDEFKPKEIMITQNAADAEALIADVLGRAGYQSVLFNVEDKAMVTVVNRTLLPTLSEIRELFEEESPIPARCGGEDELDLGMPRERCATCDYAWIKSTACAANIDLVAEKGMAVRVSNDGRIEDVVIRPTRQQLNETRASVQTGLEQYLKSANEDWAKSVSEIDDKLRSKLTLDEQYTRKDLHQPKIAEKATSLVTQFAESMAENMRPQESPAGISPDLLAFMERQAEQQAKRDEQMQQFMTGVIDKIASKEAAPAPSEPEAADAKPPAKTK